MIETGSRVFVILTDGERVDGEVVATIYAMDPKDRVLTVRWNDGDVTQESPTDLELTQ